MDLREGNSDRIGDVKINVFTVETITLRAHITHNYYTVDIWFMVKEFQFSTIAHCYLSLTFKGSSGPVRTTIGSNLFTLGSVTRRIPVKDEIFCRCLEVPNQQYKMSFCLLILMPSVLLELGTAHGNGLAQW